MWSNSNPTLYEKFEYTTEVIRSRKLKKNNIKHNGQNKKDTTSNNDIKTLHRKLRIEHRSCTKNHGATGTTEEQVVPTPLVSLVVVVMLLLLQTRR